MRFPKKKKKGIVKPNVIPILDAVFIFIFFLLMSAQFLEIYEIGTDAPAVKTVATDKKDDEKPLNLTLVVTKKGLTLQKGVPSENFRTIAMNSDGNYDLEKLEKSLIEIKSKHGHENSIIIKPQENVEYKKIVWIMDAVREVDNKKGPIMTTDNKGNKKETRTLFDQIIFETII